MFSRPEDPHAAENELLDDLLYDILDAFMHTRKIMTPMPHHTITKNSAIGRLYSKQNDILIKILQRKLALKHSDTLAKMLESSLEFQDSVNNPKREAQNLMEMQ